MVWEVVLERENERKCKLERESSLERERMGFWGCGECSKVEERERFLPMVAGQEEDGWGERK